MAWQTKWTAQRGRHDLEDVAVTAGSAEQQSDTISVNIDADAISKGEALLLLEKIGAAIHAGPWPPRA